MNLFLAYLTSLTPVVGWTLIHFLWQGLLIALALQLALKACRTPQARHNWALAALLLMAAAPLATFLWLNGDVRIVLVPAGFPGLTATRGAGWQTAVVTLWLVGVCLLALRMAGGLLVVERLRQGAEPLPPVWAERCRRLQARIAGPFVSFGHSVQVAAPLVAGWFRPMVLIPTAALSGLPVDQLEALILHELAHVRRLDAFANLIQAIVEIALFYHPAVWWVSRRVRIEREHCCDDMAVAAVADPAVYVRALQSMDALKASPTVALAANGGQLKARAARILGMATTPTQPPLPRTAAVLVLVLGAMAMTYSIKVQARPTLSPAAAPPIVETAEPAVASDVPKRIVLVQAAASRAEPKRPLAEPDPDDPASMPPDSDPAGQAAWRVRRYDRQIGEDRLEAASAHTQAELASKSVNLVKTDDPHRMSAVSTLDQYTSLEALNELHEQAAQMARDAVAQAEAVRLGVAAGTRSADDLAAARQQASTAARNAATADKARSDKVQADNSRFLALSNLSSSADSTHLADLTERARLEGIAYGAVRDAVEAGERPASDLEAAAQMLKAAQSAMYDARDRAEASSKAAEAEFTRQERERADDQQAQITALEADLPTLPATIRPMFEDQLRQMKSELETERKERADMSTTEFDLPDAGLRPALPILPGRL